MTPTGRTLSKWTRVYGNGYDLSGHTRRVGQLPWSFAAPDISTLTDLSDNYLLGQSTIGPFTLSAILNNTAVSGIHTLAYANTAKWDVMVAIGMRAEPVQADPVWCGKFPQATYLAGDEGGAVTCTINFGKWDGSDMTIYKKPWGTLVHALSAATGANAAAGYDDGAGASTAYGGFMMYQITAYGGTGSATISIDDSANNADFLALSGATTGAIAHTSMPCAGIIELGRTATVRQYIRWQLALNTLTSVTFALAFVRGNALQ